MKTKLLAVLVMAFALAVLLPAVHADTFNFTVSNGSISPTASSYGTVTLLCASGCDTSSSTITIDFLVATGYSFHNAGVGWNVATLDAGDSITSESVTTCTTFGGATCTLNTTSGAFDGFGSFAQSVSGGTGSSSGITDAKVTITGVDLDLADFEVSNGDAQFAAQVSPQPCSTGCGTGYAATTGAVNTPEPSTSMLLGFGLLGLVGLRRKQIFG